MIKGGVQVIFIVSTYRCCLDGHPLPLIVASSSDSGLGIEGMLQDSFPSQIPAQGREVFRGDDDGFGGGKAGGRKILVAADGLYFPGVAVEIRHRGSYSHCLPLPGQHAGGLVPPMGDVDDFHSESYAWRKWRGRVDVPPLLFRFPARCLSSHPCRHALARHLLLPFPGDGHPGLAEMDC